ncbi:MotA/TolQ/ExbB proton channel family protein [Helicobacter muridarum]|uniref:Biopolymer transport protein n=1 Tax=Helicobacter muridarum TaxID=216 RepID=A0A099TZR9_9HELI|nr:MotA/TolQ/ExbB proton channel family protein [Helicobacter muridarum]TLD99547.1 MotA/TolQ/ExbB proton channel family protein [Helicobacter muridarum]STQ85880.1 biopolymer transport protein [Helicobacter muridarum]
MEMFIRFFETSGIITLIVIAWLSIYLIVTFWIFIYKWFIIRGMQDRESYSLDLLLSKDINIPQSAVFTRANGHNILSKEMLHVWKEQLLRNASNGLTFLSIVSSTAPFIGLFGTVVEILEAFSHLGSNGQATFEAIAPIISKALVATAWGILCAIPAYSFYMILRRNISVLGVCLQSQIDIAISAKDNNQEITIKKTIQSVQRS